MYCAFRWPYRHAQVDSAITTRSGASYHVVPVLTVNLTTASGLPSGTTANFNPASVTSGGSSTLTLSTSASTPNGTYTVTITGTGETATRTTTWTLTVSGVGGNRTFTNDSEREAGSSVARRPWAVAPQVRCFGC